MHTCICIYICCCSVAKQCLDWFATPWTAARQASLCPSLFPGVCSSSCPLSQWCHPTISSCHPLLLLTSIFSSIRVFSNESALQIRWLKYWSFSFSISLPMSIQGWFPLGLTSLISWQSRGLSRVFFSTTIQKHQFLGSEPFLSSDCHICTWLLEKP